MQSWMCICQYLIFLIFHLLLRQRQLKRSLGKRPAQRIKRSPQRPAKWKSNQFQLTRCLSRLVLFQSHKLQATFHTQQRQIRAKQLTKQNLQKLKQQEKQNLRILREQLQRRKKLKVIFLPRLYQICIRGVSGGHNGLVIMVTKTFTSMRPAQEPQTRIFRRPRLENKRVPHSVFRLVIMPVAMSIFRD
mmetsp:Transcript_51905/g.92429  ORF Transcript_51905/g.92429 Transcript_51905/m.92429 type:complete len:189 (+) Transcript_51905:245-811(+)